MLDPLLFDLFNWSQVRGGPFARRIRPLALVAVAAYLRIRYWLIRIRLKLVKRFRKLRVVFVIGDECKWKCQTVYDAMVQSELFDPYVAPTMMDLGWIDDALQPERVRKCREYLLACGCKVLDMVDAPSMTAYPFSKCKADIVIYQQPWGMPKCQSPIAVSRYALTFYTPYFIAAIGVPWLDFEAPFHKLTYGSLMENEAWVGYYKSKASRYHVGSRLFACGCPMRDAIAAYSGKAENAVIFAPHWSLPLELNHGSSNDSTFLWSGALILEYAKRHLDVHWIFKPHPMLRIKLIQCKVMTEKEVDEYWGAWREVGEVVESGDYIPLFYRSRAMVTDCMSFQSEYLIVNRPLIHLRSEFANKPLPPGEKLETAFYDAWNEKELLDKLALIVENQKDPMWNKRTAVRHELGFDDNHVSGRMIDIISAQI